MTSSRALLSLLILTGTTAAAVVACGGDDDSGASTPVDSGSDIVPVIDASPTTAQAVAAPVTIYYGASVKLDATPSTGPSGFTYTWAFSSVPVGSTITVASLTDATTAGPGFQPDIAGAYTLTLTVAGGGSSSTIPVAVNVVDPPVFYARADNDGGGLSTASINVVGAGFGDGGTAVSCFARDAGGNYNDELSTVGAIDTDWWEAPAGQPSRVVYAFETREDGGAHTSLLASTSDQTCATAPLKLDEVGIGTPRATRALEEPRFSPSGARIAYLRTLGIGTTVTTVGFDGSGRRDLAPFYAYPDGGASPDASTTGTNSVTRPTWVDETTIAWIQTGSTGWQIVSAADAPGATTKLVMTCTGTVPRQLAVLPSGEILVAQQTTGANTFLLAYTPDPATKACGTARDLSKLPAAGSALDFSLSPDRTMIAYAGVPDSGLPSEIRVIKTDGSFVSTTTISSGTLGPHWVGGGAFLSWPAVQATFDASVSSTGPVIAVTQIDGGSRHQITQATSGSSVIAGIGNGFCAMGRNYGSGVTLFGILGVAGLRLARRRKNTKR